MIAATPPTHAIGTAAFMVVYRGGHATKPKALAHVALRIVDGDYRPAVGRGCVVTYSPLTPYAKSIGVEGITSVWCPA